MVTKGMTIRDNDPRELGRELIVDRVDDRYAYCRHVMFASLKSRILLRRIHDDGKGRHSGFSVVR